MTFDFKNKVVLITCAPSGLGYAFAVAFAISVANLAITHISHNSLDKSVVHLLVNGEGFFGFVE